MKKHTYNSWMRLLACFICTISLLGIGLGAVATYFFIENPDKEVYLKDGNENLMLNYALYAIEHEEELESQDFLADTNLYMSFNKIEYLDDNDSVATNREIFSNMPEGVKPTNVLSKLYAAADVYYSIDSLAQAMNVHYNLSDRDRMSSVIIDGYVFDVNKGIFYYHTEKGYFKADYVYVSEGGMSYDYRLTVRDGREIYYNSYYDKILDTSNYHSWDWIRLSVKKMGITSEYYGAMVQLIEDSSIIENELCSMNYYVDNYHVFYVSEHVSHYQVKMALSDTLTKQDLFVEYKAIIDVVYSYEGLHWWVLSASVFGLIIGLVLLAISAAKDKEELTFFHRIPLLLFTGMIAGVEVLLAGGIFLYMNFLGNRNGWQVNLTGVIVPTLTMGSVMIFLMFVYLANLMSRIRTKTFWRYTVLYYLSRPIVAVYRAACENISLFWKGVMVLSFVTLVELFIFGVSRYHLEMLFGLFIIEKIIVIFVVVLILLQMQKLRDGAKHVTSGELNHKIDASGMYGVFKEHAEDINRMSDGIKIAVEDQMKSERFKTELITNVSHDIKTPLTSIINYVDLMKKEEITDSTILEYMDVLDRQSARLKKLIEDLMEASKASTGNMEVHLEKCNLGVFLTQVVGEFEDKLSANGLEAVVVKPEDAVYVLADGRLLWRVFENLMNNVCKYSQANTRVYVTLEVEGDNANVVFKNISKTALNISSEQLLQRFVRGDSSRHTEGSGLGLSIAQSLTELMDGQMRLDIDGDLFKATVKFNVDLICGEFLEASEE